MPAFNALYYPTWNPPVDFFRASLLFFDRFEVIIPDDVATNYEEANAKVIDLIPDAFHQHTERQYDLSLSDEAWQRFGLALDLLVEEAPPSNEISFLLKPGAVQIEDHVFLHDAKLNHRIKTELESRRLLRPDIGPYLEHHIPEGFNVIDERASRLVLSMHADAIARRQGLRTITDEPIAYTLNALSGSQNSRQTDVQSQLACSVISTEVPDMIKMLSPEEFVELRKRFEPVRKPFQRAMRDLCDDYMLADVSDAATLDCKIREITQDYHREVEKFRSGRFASAISAWTPFGVGVLADALGIPGKISLGMAGMCVSVVVQLFEKTRGSGPEDATTQSQRLIAGLRRELLSPSLIKRMAAR